MKKAKGQVFITAFLPEYKEPKPVPMATAKTCARHKITTWGGIPCWKCMEAVNKRRAKTSGKNYERQIGEVEYMEAASKFCEKTGAFVRGFDPGFTFVLYKDANWPETLQLSSLAVKRIAEAMK